MDLLLDSYVDITMFCSAFNVFSFLMFIYYVIYQCWFDTRIYVQWWPWMGHQRIWTKMQQHFQDIQVIPHTGTLLNYLSQNYASTEVIRAYCSLILHLRIHELLKRSVLLAIAQLTCSLFLSLRDSWNGLSVLGIV